jgi:hypothetical protein
MVQVSSKMSVDDLFQKISKIFQVNKNMIILTYTFKPPNCSESIDVEIAPSNESSLYHALEALDNYAKLMVELKVQNRVKFSLSDGKRKIRTKETISELFKRGMGLHTDEGQRKRGFLDAKWTTRCDKLMVEDSRLLLEFDKLKLGIGLALGDARFLISPFQVICPICANIVVLRAMNQPRALVLHMKDKHDALAADIILRLRAWVSNNFITNQQMEEKAKLPSTIISPATVLSTPWAREVILACDILQGHLHD